jgi:phosphodiesterase/alkaline phosphatase D-like protein
MMRAHKPITAVLVVLGVFAGGLVFAGASALAVPLQAPVIGSQSAAEVTPVGVVLEANFNPEGGVTAYYFEYATSPLLTGASTSAEGSFPAVVEELGSGPVRIAGLEAATTYYYRVVAINASGTTDGAKIEHFTTSALEKPAIAEESASAVGQSAALLAGTVNPEFQPLAVCEFEFVSEAVFNATGFSVSPGLASCAPSAGELGEGGSSEAVAAGLSGLEANTTYYYRLLAENATGTSEGAPESFLTLPDPPTVITGEASEVTPYTATISGSVNPGSVGANSDTTYYFQYSTDRSYSSQIPLAAADAGQGVNPVAEQASLTGLEPDTIYHYRIVASNDNANTAGGAPQVVYGQGREFKTPATPPLLGGAQALDVTQSSAAIEATLVARGLPTRWELQLADTQGSLDFQAAGNSEGSTAETLALSAASLSPGTVYYYKLVAVNADGTVETPESSFTTLPAPPPVSINLYATAPLLSIPANSFPAEEAGTVGKSTTKALSRAQKLKNALRACHKKAKGKHAACEKAARKRYGATARKKK